MNFKNIASLRKQISPFFDSIDVMDKLNQGGPETAHGLSNLPDDEKRTVENKDIIQVERLFIEIRESFLKYITSFQRSRPA